MKNEDYSMEIEFKINVTPEECAELITLTAQQGLTPGILVDRFLKGAIRMHNGTDMNKCNERIMDTIEYMGDRNSFLAYMFSRRFEELDGACDLAEEVLHSIWSRNGCKDTSVMDEKNLNVERAYREFEDLYYDEYRQFYGLPFDRDKEDRDIVKMYSYKQTVWRADVLLQQELDEQNGNSSE